MSQALEALQVANEVRLRRAAVKRELREAKDYREARAKLADLIENLPEGLGPMPVWPLLCAGRYFGPSTARRYLRRAGVPQQGTLAELTERQRTRLVMELRS